MSENKNEIVLSEIDVCEKLPVDFYQNEKFIAGISSLNSDVSKKVYQLTDIDRKQSKSDIANVRKFVKNVTKHVKQIVAEKSSEQNAWQKEVVTELSLLTDSVAGLAGQFKEMEDKKLEEIDWLLKVEIAYAWNESGVRNQFQSDLEVLKKAKLLSSITPKGILTKKAKDYVASICANNLEKQRVIDSRVMALQNKCMMSGVEHSALTKEHIGDAFYSVDDAIFNARVDELIKIEVDKKEAEKVRIDAERQKAVDDALKAQQVETDRKAREKADADMAEKERAEVIAQHRADKECADNAESQRKLAIERQQFESDKESQAEAVEKFDSDNDKLNDNVPSQAAKKINGKRDVTVTASFTFENVSETVSDTSVENKFLKLMTESLLNEIMLNVSVES